MNIDDSFKTLKRENLKIFCKIKFSNEKQYHNR